MAELFSQKKAAKPAALLKKTTTTEQQTIPDNSEIIENINKTLGQVSVFHGAQELTFNLAGKSVAYVREALGAIMQVPKDAEAQINGTPVKIQNESTTILGNNAVLEFVKAAGVKG